MNHPLTSKANFVLSRQDTKCKIMDLKIYTALCFSHTMNITFERNESCSFFIPVSSKLFLDNTFVRTPFYSLDQPSHPRFLEHDIPVVFVISTQITCVIKTECDRQRMSRSSQLQQILFHVILYYVT